MSRLYKKTSAQRIAQKYVREEQKKKKRVKKVKPIEASEEDLSNTITRLSISLSEIDRAQEIDQDREWSPIFDGREVDPEQKVFIGFLKGDSPPLGDEVEYTGYMPGEEAFWVYKTSYTVEELELGIITPKELIEELKQEQPNIEIVGLCKYTKNK
jgi:hypothetical protein